MPRLLFTVLLSILCLWISNQQAVAKDSTEPLQYNRDIRPILSEACFRCHGADKNSREADLRLDERDAVVGETGIIVPGDPSVSDLILRITSNDESERMPPPEEHRQLSKKEITLLRRWITEGATYEKHWAFIAPQRLTLPKVKNSDWSRNAIDHFVLSKLEQGGLQPSAEADKATLIRRVTFDLTGLPPTLAEVDAFLADLSPGAYEKVVDRLLTSSRFGEHFARYWLDAARYADTGGFFTDDERQMWLWRDWVINAFNSNMPFDQFTIEQLAGDLLPKPTQAQRIATGFNRNHMTTHETGVIDEEYRVEYVVDRLKTTSTTWLGLTVGCARCHDHKYDPISQKEFFQLFAFFNNGPIKGNTGRAGNVGPILKIPSANYETRLQELKQEADKANEQLKQIEPDLQAALLTWEESALAELPSIPTDGLAVDFPMETINEIEDDPNAPTQQSRTTSPGVKFSEEMFGRAAQFDGDAVIESPDCPDLDRTDAFSYGTWFYQTSGLPACLISKNDEIKSMRGFDLMLRKGKAVAHFINTWNSSAIQVMTTTSIPRNQWQHLMVTYDGSSTAAGVKIYLNGESQPLEVRHDTLQGTIKAEQPLRIGRRSTSAAFIGSIDEVRIYDKELTAHEIHRLATSQFVQALVGTPTEKRTAIQKKMLRDHFLRYHAPSNFQQAQAKTIQLGQKVRKFNSSVPTTMVMQEMVKARDTYLLERGEYDQHGEKVIAGVPDSLPPLADSAPPNRLGLAQWLVNPAHPLTSRVIVNRFWQQHFGTGIVKTVEDFGTQGEWPSHPELLDWLAVEFIENGWDVKQIQRLIVTSATYRQSSKMNQTEGNIRQIDPGNRLLGRGPRFRLDAEVVRDNALSISGLLIERLGGASVKPYQPQGLWAAVSYDGSLTYPQDHGDGLYRRSMYTFWKRQSPPPGMLAFGAPTRETCTVRRPRTNTPLQALTLMNDTTYVEASRVLAQRMLTEPDASTLTARLRFAFRLATARDPEPDESELLLGIYQKQLTLYQKNKEAAEKLLHVGESESNKSLDTAEHAAWTTVASILLNMDETVTKN